MGPNIIREFPTLNRSLYCPVGNRNSGRSLSGNAQQPTTPTAGATIDDSEALETATDNGKRLFSPGTAVLCHPKKNPMSISIEAGAMKYLGKRSH